ncbi:MAG: RNA methyltransferase [Pseudomonadota bacterium]
MTASNAAWDTSPHMGPVFVLVRPQMGENIGAAARAMLNFGLTEMRLVAPRDGWPNARAVATASGASRVIDGARVVDTVDAALGDLTTVFATTARSRELTKRVLDPASAMAEAAGRISAGERVGVLFGPERAGLENADLVAASALVSVPVNPDFASINLAHCVLLLAYEWRQRAGAGLPAPAGRALPASALDRQRLVEGLEDRLARATYFWPEAKEASLRENLRNLIGRLELTDADVRTLHGVFRALADRHPTRADAPPRTGD